MRYFINTWVAEFWPLIPIVAIFAALYTAVYVGCSPDPVPTQLPALPGEHSVLIGDQGAQGVPCLVQVGRLGVDVVQRPRHDVPCRRQVADGNRPQ